jgi:ribosomal protein S8
MTMTDPIADMLTRLRNANSAFHETVAMPHSKLKSHIAEILQQEGYIGGFAVAETEGDAPGKVLTPGCRVSSAVSASRSSRPRLVWSPTDRPPSVG